LNDGGEFEKHHNTIYPKELTLKKENTNNDQATFLDLDIKIVDNKFEYDIYDKRNAYNFYIVRFPYRESNIPSKMFYSSIGAETLRICRTTLKYDRFIVKARPFFLRMQKQGCSKIKDTTKVNKDIIKTVRKVINRNKEQFSKYEVSTEQITKDIFPQ
jgi:hypothetical protein